jgi:hypothetical protein
MRRIFCVIYISFIWYFFLDNHNQIQREIYNLFEILGAFKGNRADDYQRVVLVVPTGYSSHY